MKIVMLGNYAVYFIPRLIHFNNFLADRKSSLFVVEESESHRLYTFATKGAKEDLNRIVLFPKEEEVSPIELQKRAKKVLDEINPDVVVTGYISFPFGAIGLRWAKENRKGVVEYDNQKIDTFPRGLFVKNIKKMLLRNVD